MDDINHIIEQFRAAILEAGLYPPETITPDGEIHRFSSSGQFGDDAGWYVLHADDVPAGAFGDWRTSVEGKWTIGRRLSPLDRTAYCAKTATIRKQRDAEKNVRMSEARGLASAIWQAADETAADHPYIRRKGVEAHETRVSGDSVVVPLFDGSELCSLQFIDANGGKRFLTGGRVGGCYFMIGNPTAVICIAEGFVTAATIHEATGYAGAVAFSAGNLLAVAKRLRAEHPDARIVLCADDDMTTPGNPGVTKARTAAEEVDGVLAVPAFGIDRPGGVSDFNDLRQFAGPDAVRDGIEKALTSRSVIFHEEGDEDRDDDHSWPELRPIVATMKPVRPFDVDALLPKSLRDWIVDESERMPCPIDFVAVTVVVALGSIVGARCGMKPKARDSWLVIPNLWGGIVGDPSAKKTPACSAALRPMEALIASARESYESAQRDHETEKVVFDARREALHTQIKEAVKKPASGDPLKLANELRNLGDRTPVAPVMRRFKTNDTTVEKLGELLRDNPTGLLVLRDELVGLIASWEREGREGDRAFFLEGWNGNQSFDTDRISRGHISIPNVCVSIFGGIQPEKLTMYLEQAAHALANDGMLQRFQLLVYPDACPWEYRDRSPDQSARQAAFAVFAELAAFDPICWGASRPDDDVRFPYFNFSDEAQCVFIEWSDHLHRELVANEEDPLIKQHLTKFDKLFPALALILHLVDCAAGDVQARVSKEAALRAAAWCEYLETHARRCYGLLKDDGLRAAQALATKLRRGALEDGFTLRDVRRHQWRSLTNDEAIQAALDWLLDEGWLRAEAVGGVGPGSGRPTLRYRIHPTVIGERTS